MTNPGLKSLALSGHKGRQRAGTEPWQLDIMAIVQLFPYDPAAGVVTGA